MKSLLLFFVFLSFSQVNAQESFIIKDVKLFDGEKIIEKTSVKVVGDRIEEISSDIKASKNIKIINGKGKTLMPALSNAHVHAWSPMSLKQAAKAGVLNVMDMFGVEQSQAGMRKLKDSTDYARYFVSGYGATSPDGHGTQYGFPVPTIEKPEDAKGFVADRVKSKVDYIKIIVEPYRKTLSHETVAEVIKEAHKANLKAVVHISRLDDGLKVLENNADGLVHIWWDKPVNLSQLKKLNKKKDFFIIPTMLTTLKVFENLGKESEEFLSKEELLVEIKKIYQAGVPILAGTDPPNLGINYGTDLYEELFLFEEAGLPHIEILKSATVNVAQAFNLKNIGRIQNNYMADMLLINGDPTQNIRDIKNVEIIWKAGKIIK